jgi:hypothetical protein
MFQQLNDPAKFAFIPICLSCMCRGRFLCKPNSGSETASHELENWFKLTKVCLFLPIKFSSAYETRALKFWSMIWIKGSFHLHMYKSRICAQTSKLKIPIRTGPRNISYDHCIQQSGAEWLSSFCFVLLVFEALRAVFLLEAWRLGANRST